MDLILVIVGLVLLVYSVLSWLWDHIWIVVLVIVAAFVVLVGLVKFFDFIDKKRKGRLRKLDDSAQLRGSTTESLTTIKNTLPKSKVEQLEELYSYTLKSKGATFKYQTQKIYIQTSIDADIQDLMCCGKRMNTTINSINPIIYEIYDKKDELVLTISYEEKVTKGSVVFCCSFDFMDELIPVKVIKDEFFSNCCTITKNIVFCYLQNRQIDVAEKTLSSIIEYGIKNVPKISNSLSSIEERVLDLLNKSDYNALFKKEIELHYEDETIIINYQLPNRENFLKTKEYKYNAKTNKVEQKLYAETVAAKIYEKVLYSICLRSVYEVFVSTDENKVSNVVFNGYIDQINPSTGQRESKYILSISVNRNKFNEIVLEKVDPKLCFKTLKGVSAAKIADIVAITPILTFDKNDKRLIDSKNIVVDEGTNLAIMDWTEFEHLVRELFEKEFSKSGGEVRVTQASRDGGVDAIVYDPDPIRGGKIVIQAKRYTNTVSVSAVRDLYGTVINEGANSGILITTSDYGGDSYEFAKNKPLKLLNGGHLLGLLEKHGKKGYINIREAKMVE